MNKSSRFFIFISLLILVSLACNAPIINQIVKNVVPPEDTTDGDTTSYSVSDVSDSFDPGIAPPANTDGAEVTYIPGATFLMGSVTTDLLADEDEHPQHEVTVDEFYIYTNEVTNQMYGDCVDAGFCMKVQSLEAGPTSHFEDPDFSYHPVVGVDWVMARDYCAWAGARLPTEAEWELVSRGPDSLLYPWGEEEPTCDYVNMGGCFDPEDTQPVGNYLMGNSPDGVWDMSGNVWEWIHDWYVDDYYAQSPSDNPIGPFEPQDPENPLRVVRGGGMFSEPVRMRSAARIGINPYRVFDDVGFRCVVGEGLSLPEAYDHGLDRHERVPPDRVDDGGDSADDFDDDDRPSIFAHGTHGPCPDEGGNISLTVHAGADFFFTNVIAFLGGVRWDDSCIYDAVTETAICEGPAPAGYLDPVPPSMPLSICFVHDEGTDCVTDLLLWKPIDCGRDASWLSIDLLPVCEEIEGVVTPAVLVLVVPPDAPFGSASTVADFLTCIDDGPDGNYLCYDLPGSPRDVLAIHVSFTDGRSRTDTVEFPVCGDDGGPSEFRLDPHCLDGDGVITPGLILQFWDVEATFTGASIDGTDLICEDIGFEVYTCHGLPGDPGDELDVTATFDDGSTMTNSVFFPPCGGERSRMYHLTPDCEGIPGAWTEIVVIEYSGVEADFTFATANGALLTCVEAGVDTQHCQSLPGSPRDDLWVTANFSDGTSMTQITIFPECGALDFDPHWVLAGADCLYHDDLAPEFYAIIDTFMAPEWIETSWSLEGVSAPKTCSLDEPPVGRWYCNFAIAAGYDELTFCADWVGSPGEHCETFDDIEDWLPESCPVDRPGDDGDDDCNQWTT